MVEVVGNGLKDGGDGEKLKFWYCFGRVACFAGCAVYSKGIYTGKRDRLLRSTKKFFARRSNL